MAAFEHPSFHYHAEGHAFSGHFTRPLTQQIEALAGVSLPLSGGHGRSHAEEFSIGQMVSVKKAYSHVSGSQGNDKKYNSHTTVVLEGVNILDVVTADRIVARLTSEHDPDPKQREGHIIALGTKFENLRISGCPVEVEFDHELFLKNKTFAALSKNLAALKKSGRMAEESNGVILCSLVKTLKADCPGVTVEGHVITVEHFGKIYVGEVLAEPGFKRISMLRLQLGSPHEGLLNTGEASINGLPWP
jgi:hypothetical protein